MLLKDIGIQFQEKNVFSSFTREFGKYTCLVGPSGKGKTTLLKIIAGLCKPDSGTVENGPERPAFMFQDDLLFPWLTVLENVRIVCDDENRALQYLSAVELDREANSYPDKLSGGMKRRVALARALAYDGDMLILDEPFNGMDLPLVQRLLPLLEERSLPVILTTHSPSVIQLLEERNYKIEEL